MIKKIVLLITLCVLILPASAQVSRMESDYMQLAARYQQQDKSIIKELRDYLKTYPYTTYEDEVHFMIGVLQLERGQFKQCLKDLNQADLKVLSKSHREDCIFYRGYAYFLSQSYGQAAQYFELLNKEHTIYETQADYYCGYCYYKMGEYEKSLKTLLRMEHMPEYRPTVPYYIVQIYYALHNTEEVRTRAEALLTEQPNNENNTELHRILGEICIQQGDYDAAIRHLDQYATSAKANDTPLERNDLYLLGQAQYHSGQYEKAITSLKLVKNQNDTISESAYFLLANAYRQTGQVEQAKLSYQAAMSMGLTPTLSEEAMYNYTLTTFEASTALGESITAFTDFLNTYPNSKHTEQVYQLMSDAFRRSQNYAAALEALESIQNCPARMEDTKQILRYQLGTDAFLQGKLKDANRWFSEVINHSYVAGTKNILADTYYWRAEARYRLHDYTGAEQDIKVFLDNAASRQNKNYNAAIYLRAYTYFSQRKFAEAEGSYSQVLRIVPSSDPMYADALNRLGDCAFQARAFERAIGYYGQVVSGGATGSDYALFQKGYAEGLLRRHDAKIRSMRQLVNTYPKSDYADDGLYEIARAELQRNSTGQAIDAYEQLLRTYPNSNMARKASLEVAMLYRNNNDNTMAIQAYKNTISKYPASEEAYAALDGLEAIYIEMNNVQEYTQYTKQLSKLNMQVTTKDDSLAYVAAELQYMQGNYQVAATSLKSYISQYCAGGRYCTSAQYYLADSYYRLGKTTEALAAYKTLTEIQGNPYMQEACVRIAEISYDTEDYATALTYFYRILDLASSKSESDVAQLGILRCSYFLGNHKTTIDIASQILTDQTDTEIRQEALYNRGKAYAATHQYAQAIVDLQPIAEDVRTAMGAQSKYLVAECRFYLGDLDKAEEEVRAFTKMNTQQKYWLAKALILLSDINLQKGDEFMARQYLISLQANYKQSDDIQQIIAERLQLLDEREKEKIETEETEE